MLKRCLGLGAIAGVAAAVWATGVAVAGQPLKVSRVTSVQLDNQDAKDIILETNEILQFTDGSGDVSCNTNFTRDGDVYDFSSPESITTAAEYQTVCGKPGRVHVVKDIQWCNNGSCTNCKGCSDRPGLCMVVVREAFLRKQAVLWAHEYGHNVGLCDVFDDNWVMNRSNGEYHRKVTRTECDAFEGVRAPIPTCSVSHEPTDFETFLRREYIHGTPYAEARAYLTGRRTTRDLVDTLRKALRDPEYAPYHDNVALTFGYIGDREAFEPLVEFIEAPGSGLSREQLVARRSAVVALGYLHFHSRDPRVLQYLSNAVLPAEWGRRLRAQLPAGGPTLAEALHVASIHALGISGTPEAAQILRQALPSTIDSALGQVINESLQLNQRVQKEQDKAFQNVGQHR